MVDNTERSHVPRTRATQILSAAKATLAREIEIKGYTYVGPNAERRFRLNRQKFNAIVEELTSDGYIAHYLEVEKPDTDEDETVIIKILCSSLVTAMDAWTNRDKILKLWLDAQPNGI